MGRRRKFGRTVSGVIVLNKSLGMSSNEALQQAKRLFFASKAGHTGALDPLATGVLPLCFGEATKFSQYLLDSDKGYRARVQLGVRTTTGDLEGEVVEEADTYAITQAQIESVLDKFRGETDQVPSIYSALKYEGKPLYEYARKGIDVPRESRQITIYNLMASEFQLGEKASFMIEVDCSKGTYIRTLAEDIGQALGVGAHVTELHRTRAGFFTESDAYTLEDLEQKRGENRAEALDRYLLPVDTLVRDFESVELDQQSMEFFIAGQAVMYAGVYRFAQEKDIVRTFSDTGEFLGIGEVTDECGVQPKRLVVRDQNTQ